jgi:microsomal epoxide hydrolase
MSDVRHDLSPFEIHVPDGVLDDLKYRLEHARWPEQITGTGWESGTDSEFLRELVEYWRTTFDWRAVESRLNSYPQFTVTVDEQNVHFVHARSAEPEARPLLLLHGWPGSPLEFLDVVDRLIDPVSHGGRPEDAFHVVVPSLPGFAFSGPTTARGWHEGRIAEAMHTVMTLAGYDSYYVHGGDYGSLVASQLSSRYPDNVLGLHLTMIVCGPLPTAAGEMTEEESILIADQQVHNQAETGYIAIQATKPQTLAYALEDSPVGLAAWIVEKLRAWSDNDGNLNAVISHDEILANVTTYWVTRTAGSSIRLYHESAVAGLIGVPPTPNTVPVSVAVFPKELYRSTRRIAEHYYNIVRWTPQPAGGHFAGLEQPTLLADDITASFALLSADA